MIGPEEATASASAVNSQAAPQFRLAVVIVNYRTPDFTIDCLQSLADKLDTARDVVVIVDNESGDDSPQRIAEHVARSGWAGWVRLIHSDTNVGFAAGNNIGLNAVTAELYLLLNSDTVVKNDAIDTLIDAMAQRPDVGIVSPKLVIPDGSTQNSCYRFTLPVNELCGAARTRFLERLLHAPTLVIRPDDQPVEVEWTSFACALLRGRMLDDVGLLDGGYFMYFDDIDYCRMAHRKGWLVLNVPAATVLHRRGGSGDTVKNLAKRKRLPRYYWASRARYFAKNYGTVGLWWTNSLWTVGRLISLAGELVGVKQPHTVELEWRDIWTNALHPLRMPRTPPKDAS
ncbi:MAG: family 2 glycosyl transferase [Planctomycetaceae bacterium]|nr:family 2 glycosyl transferase [Planctomycetaceae bacterium]